MRGRKSVGQVGCNLVMAGEGADVLCKGETVAQPAVVEEERGERVNVCIGQRGREPSGSDGARFERYGVQLPVHNRGSFH